MEPGLARTIWHALEPLNAVAYFSPECREVPEQLGLKGFWMGYFACRAAPLGPVSPGVVEATFFNFHPDRVGRAIPDAWEHAGPGEIVEARATAAAGALRRLLGDEAERVAIAALPLLAEVIGGADPAGRPLFAANRDLGPPDDPVEALWQAATTLREHRGDGHVALLVGAGLDGCEAHVLFAAEARTDPELFQRSRGWSGDDWAAASSRLAARGLLTGDGELSADGHALRDSIERRTDELAVAAYESVGEGATRELVDLLGPAADRVTGAGEIIFPNPMGLPRRS